MTELLGRLLARTTPVGDCLEWTGCTDKQGYGRVKVLGRSALAHRLVYEEATGEDWPEVRHSCDNPPCIRPDHLLGGTHADNMRDMMERGRSTRGRPRIPGVGQRDSRTPPETVAAILAYDRKIVSTYVAKDLGISVHTVRRIRRQARLGTLRSIHVS